MAIYFSTHIPGLGEVAGRQLAAGQKRTVVPESYEGLVIYESDVDPGEVRELRYFNNSYLLIGKVPGLKEENSISRMAEELAETDKSKLNGMKGTFRIMASLENKPASIPEDILRKTEQAVTKDTGMKVDRTSPVNEILLLYRREGFGLVGLKLTSHRDYKKTLVRGELRPELANLMCLISEPGAGEVVLDPFAGSGAILSQRKLFEYRRLISGDIKPTKKFIKKMDAMNMKQIGNDSIDKIITDPPWGISSGQGVDMDRFYTKMTEEFARVLKPGGLAVVLTGAKTQFEKALEKHTGLFEIEEKYDILLSGKKAAVYRVRKKL